MKKQGIYCIEHNCSGKKYIGSSTNIEKRFSQHKAALVSDNHHCIHLQRAVNKYGIEAFKFYAVEETKFETRQELFLLEELYIAHGENLYNVGSVGGGDNLTNHPDKEDIIRRITDTVNRNIEKMTDKERREKWGREGEANGRWKDGKSSKLCPVCNSKKIAGSAKTCMGCQSYDRKGEKNAFHGKTHTEETLSILRSKTPWTKGAKPEDQSYTKQYEITYPNGTTKTVYGLKAIATEFNTSITNVALTVERMAKNSTPTKRSIFFQHKIKVIL
jgi:group I intron endonuclease